MGVLEPVAVDIETTGFEVSDEVTVVGLALPLGCRVFARGRRRWEAGDVAAVVSERTDCHVQVSLHESETALLRAVGAFAQERFADDDVLLVAYNGERWKNGFDLPFLRTRLATLDVEWPFREVPYADLLPVVSRRFNLTMDGESRSSLPAAYEVLVDEGLNELDPFAESGEAVVAFDDGRLDELVQHNVVDVLRTAALSDVARRYCSKSDYSLKSLTPTIHDTRHDEKRLVRGASRMTDIEIWGCDKRFKSAGEESGEHLLGKVELERRRERQEEPWFDGEYYFEKKVADRVPDCFIVGGPVNRWIEIVAGSPQPYREKTREALRLGFTIYWVFVDGEDEARREARQALSPELQEPFEFGSFDPIEERLELGDPITYKNYAFPVEDMDDFKPQENKGYSAGKARIARNGGGFDLGIFDFGGFQRRLVSNLFGTYFRWAPPRQSVEDSPWGIPHPESLELLVAAGEVERLGPVRR